ncbi:hypothetical protein QJS10_CPA09g01071 [Acorus calamus]|uniref:Uncharacterized protein n=1 Tax=Acorus calamus TaxID=4465 RepID=A0AAV9E582_ACOCL|nr:hypothetical protein QJS10_CPA09g01071 [Acorus calamus]
MRTISASKFAPCFLCISAGAIISLPEMRELMHNLIFMAYAVVIFVAFTLSLAMTLLSVIWAPSAAAYGPSPRVARPAPAPPRAIQFS